MEIPTNYGKERDGEIQLWFAEKPYWNFYEFFNYSILAKVVQDLKDFYDNCYDSYQFAELIYKQKKIKIADFIDLEKFKPILGKLIAVWQNGGIFNSYVNFLKWNCGNQTNVEIKITSPACLDIKISDYNSNYFIRNLENKINYRITEDTEYIRIASQAILNITANEMLMYLQTFLPTCFYVSFDFKDKEYNNILLTNN